jgi:hypothetical protein
LVTIIIELKLVRRVKRQDYGEIAGYGFIGVRKVATVK